jgi:cell division septation protein DedD
VGAAPDANAAAPGAGDAAEQGPQPTTQAAQDTQPASQPTAGAAPVQTAASKASETQPSAAANGSFWQVIAIRDSEAEILVKTLKEKGYPASTAPGPNNLVRVLVGPYSDTPTMGRVKTELEGLGFHPIRR